jgi:hypothetical protein
MPGMAAANGGGPGGGGGGGAGGGGAGAFNLGPNYVNLAPSFGPRYRNIAPNLYRRPDLRGPEILYYNPEIPYYNPEIPVYRPGLPGFGRGYGGGGGGGGYGGGFGGGNFVPKKRMAPLEQSVELPPAMVLYISCEDGSGTGKLFQVNEHGAVLGLVNLPYPATGLAMHRDHGLIAAIPRDGGSLVQIDDSGKVHTILENHPEIQHPVDVAVGAESDTVLVADNLTDRLAALTAAPGSKPEIYHEFKGLRSELQDMSVAITRDKQVIFGTNSDPGVYRFAGDDYTFNRGPLLAGRGGVAADTASLKWAATQSPNEIHVFEGEHVMHQFKLPANKRFYRHGLLSFALTGAVVVAARDGDKVEDDPWLIQYHTKEVKNEKRIRLLFKWDRARMLDFVVGPRMYWERHEPKVYESIY